MENSPLMPKHEAAEELGHRGVAPEANQLHGKKMPPEKIGHVLMSGKAGEGKTRLPGDISKEKIDWQRAAGMGRRELLEISEGVRVDNTTLRHVYDTHLIGENGLRRLVYEHMRGGDLRERLHHEILEHETDFERDPQIRSHAPKPGQSSGTVRRGTKVPSLDELLSKAGLVKLDPGKELTAPKLLPEHLARRTGLQAHQRRLLDLAFIGIILILLILVILLAITRS